MSETSRNDAQAAATPVAPARRLEDLPPAARRALDEAEARRARIERHEAEAQREIGGRGGKDPARYGDWEIKGRAIDF
ncbi:MULTISPECIES: DUF1674 domain-containing protein [unclassified Roseitalea]|uniref:DUF1674 domain-containing protein n=1 Tax=unclassified Roseitalea TaxID=2639107 RepID=UPI00273DE41A|nr:MULTISPECIES: DUF1674 domain-containing protein [unclassified Roseitalea]